VFVRLERVPGADPCKISRTLTRSELNFILLLICESAIALVHLVEW
jgi:hypothetical protein